MNALERKQQATQIQFEERHMQQEKELGNINGISKKEEREQ